MEWAIFIWLHVLLLCSIIQDKICGVYLHRVVVPQTILNGTQPYVILDCQYTLNHSEREGLVLKWYLNGRNIYTWIPPDNPRGLGALRGMIDLDYEITPAPYSRHRALYIRRPTTAMHGEYTCKVSTLQNEVAKTEIMTVLVKPDYVDLFLGNGFDGGGGHVVSLLNVTCIVDHVFPEPEIAIFHTSGLNRVRLKTTEERVARYSNGAWKKKVHILIPYQSLYQENNFQCEVVIPNTNYSLRKDLVYIPYPPLFSISSKASNFRVENLKLKSFAVIFLHILSLFILVKFKSNQLII